MSAQLINWFANIHTVLPWVSFIAGVGGSLHCVGMCGGLVTASCHKSSEIVRYQIGRLLGYLVLGFFAGLMGRIFTIQADNPKIALVPGIIIGLLFLFWGIQNFRGKKAEMPLPKVLSRLYTHLWVKLISKNNGSSRSLLIGLLSIFLPCGLLYGVVLGVTAFEHTFTALYAMFFFWLGTVPSMVVAPAIIQKILRPLKSRLPKTYAVSLILIGVLTITFRVSQFQEANASTGVSKENIKKTCH